MNTEYIKQDLFSEAESHYVAAKSKINELLNKEHVTESAGNKTCCYNETQSSELSKVIIPEFDGNINKWEDFRDMFISVIHKDQRIPPIKKIHYLKGCLKSDASGVISRMELSAENYETAWELVVQRYDNPQRRLESDIHNLFETEPLTETWVEGIGVAMDSVHQLMRSLSKLEDFKDSIFLYALKRRFDAVTKQHWARVRSNTKIPKYEDLKTFLTQWMSSLETETVRTRKASGSKSINSKSNSKDNNREDGKSC